MDANHFRNVPDYPVMGGGQRLTLIPNCFLIQDIEPADSQIVRINSAHTVSNHVMFLHQGLERRLPATTSHLATPESPVRVD